jgi:ATP/maltotriose-dependent transcriptional regulator MalT
VLFLDDVHVLRGSESAHTLSRLLVAAPDPVRFVVCGRDGMDFDLAALTARGLVRWVTQRELKLDAQDVRELVQTVSVFKLTPARTASILTWSESVPAKPRG